ncbi:uncharacterized protein Z518_05241 [Rhinocladiella mackenziei CBS 650.93]|uniref:Uncharacterized protein n=1 Tax=Rhinocladiella mackenziei CBS 650.93 TaxID=1442369 RepID=A0A0D2H1P4_9EURO|nr:uncharacterized protein Z518_05241 [Rhinocladiella mackenziei CBS 650.93]KIX04373.1 hypothetical protein Z518_05241 [Rhinocladiella mackenziei CBS 650.93]
MDSQRPPPSTLPPSMGPGARPIRPGEASSKASHADMTQIRSTYVFSAEPEHLRIGYQLYGEQRDYQVPYESIPMNRLTRWWLCGDSERSKATGIALIDLMRGVENTVRRPITQTEVEGLTYYGCKRGMYMFNGTILGCLIGGAIAYRTRENMKFPFMNAKPLERYDHFPSRKFTIFQGQMARTWWQITRANVWALVAVIAMAPFAAAAGDVASMVGLYRDERTHQLLMEIKQKNVNLESSSLNRPLEIEHRRNAGHDQPPSQGGGQYEDAEPQGSFGISSDNTYGDRRTDMGMWSESTSHRPGDMQPPSSTLGRGSSWRKPLTPPSPPQNGRHEESDASFGSGVFFDDDDASPVARPDNGEATRGFRKDNSAEAWYRPTWYRIRTANREAPKHDPDDPYRDSSSPQFSREGDQKMRENAQKEFDDMLERERRQGGRDDYERAVRAGEEGAANSGMSAWERRRNANRE